MIETVIIDFLFHHSLGKFMGKISIFLFYCALCSFTYAWSSSLSPEEDTIIPQNAVAPLQYKVKKKGRKPVSFEKKNPSCAFFCDRDQEELKCHIPHLLYATFRPEIKELRYLSAIHLPNCRLTGALPKEIGSLPLLEHLGLENNQLSGPLPKELGNLSELAYLILNDNQFSGTIPREITSMTKLMEINLSNNRLKGSLPDGMIAFEDLIVLNVSGNPLSGNLPVDFYTLFSLVALDLSKTHIKVELSPCLYNLQSLTMIDFPKNLRLTKDFHFSKTAITTCRKEGRLIYKRTENKG